MKQASQNRSVHLWVKRLRQNLRSLFYMFQPARPVDTNRSVYQQRYIEHDLKACRRILDIGSGGNPFPLATVLADRYLEPTHHRSAQFRSDGKPIVISDIHALPFGDNQFDYVICSHVLEHVDDPIKACRELQRVAAAGFIETPTLLKDSLFSWARGMHKWHIVSIGDRLVFFEYSERQLEGIRSNAWRELIFGQSFHPLQAAYNDNLDLFNVMLEWKCTFPVTVMRRDGSVEAH